MVNLITNQTDGNNLFNVNRHISCKTSEYFKLNYDTVYKNHNQLPNNFTYDDYNTTKFMLLHQNIRGIYNKIDEFLISLSSNAPQVICLTEHDLMTEQIGNVNLGQYTLGASFCRQTYKHEGACTYVSKDIQFNTINLYQYNKEKDLEICALKLCLLSSSFTIICIYRSPTGNLTYFLNQLESILNKLYKTSTELIICGDFNVN